MLLLLYEKDQCHPDKDLASKDLGQTFTRVDLNPGKGLTGSRQCIYLLLCPVCDLPIGVLIL